MDLSMERRYLSLRGSVFLFKKNRLLLIENIGVKNGNIVQLN